MKAFILLMVPQWDEYASNKSRIGTYDSKFLLNVKSIVY